MAANMRMFWIHAITPLHVGAGRTAWGILISL